MLYFCRKNRKSFRDTHINKKNLLGKISRNKKNEFIKIPTVIGNKADVQKNKQKVPLLAEHNYIINVE